jgi:putative ATP-binding cassette transporter
VASLADTLAYPGERGAFERGRLIEVLEAVQLPQLIERLDDEAHWNRILSLGEQQRLAIARAILQRPDYLFLDEATASLDEPSEAALYALLHRRLPQATIVSIGHRSTLDAFHDRRLILVREGALHRLHEAKRKPAAE